MADLIERLRANGLDECDEAIARIEAIEAQLAKADALVDRINTWSNDNLTDENCRDWFGHVEPALTAYRAAREKAQ